jgi:hypothetical protein
LPRLQRPMRALCPHYSPHHGRGADRLGTGLLRQRPNLFLIGSILDR